MILCPVPLEKETLTHSSILAWKIPGMEEPGRLQSMGSQRVGHDWVTSLHSLHTFITGEGNGNPLQYSCLENPMDRGAWQAMGSQRVRHDWSDRAWAPCSIPKKTRGFHFPSGHLSSLDNREQQKNMRNRGESEVWIFILQTSSSRVCFWLATSWTKDHRTLKEVLLTCPLLCLWYQ